MRKNIILLSFSFLLLIVSCENKEKSVKSDESPVVGVKNESKKTNDKKANEDLSKYITKYLKADSVNSFEIEIEQIKDSLPGISLMAYSNDNLALASYLMARDLELHPNDALKQNNLAVLLYELADQKEDEEIRTKAIILSELALKAEPNNASFLNNVGVFEFKEYERTKEVDDLKSAEKFLKKAVEYAPEDSQFLARYAAILYEMKDDKNASIQARKVFDLNPIEPEFLKMIGKIPAGSYFYNIEIASLCNVDFKCKEVCPSGIIGGLMFVTCKMEESSAQMACAEGKPYPNVYNCDLDKPGFGIMIPGLFPGVSIITPFGTIHVWFKNGHTIAVDVSINAGSVGPLKNSIGIKGTYNLKNNDARISFSDGLSLSFFRNNETVQEMGKLGLSSPIGIGVKVDSDKGLVGEIKTVNGNFYTITAK